MCPPQERALRGLGRCPRLAAAVIVFSMLLSAPAAAQAQAPMSGQPSSQPQPPADAQPSINVKPPAAVQPPVHGQPNSPPQPPVYAQPPVDAQPPVVRQPAVIVQPPAAPQAPAAAAAPAALAEGRVTYRDFTVDVTGIRNSPQYDAIAKSIAHQIDIVADCGAKPELLRFFQSQVIFVRPSPRGSPGHFDNRNPGVTLTDAVAEAQKPILLHELLHAFHFRVLPGEFRNPGILTFYNRAKTRKFYPAGEYVLKDPQEFFAVTASLYLWGHVDRVPFTRERLKATQPVYYAWLGQLLGVQK